MKILIVGNGAHTKKRILPALKKINKIQSISIGDKNAEEEAKNRKIGLWKNNDAQPPWVWRSSN